jgi:hypothetical protein
MHTGLEVYQKSPLTKEFWRSNGLSVLLFNPVNGELRLLINSAVDVWCNIGNTAESLEMSVEDVFILTEQLRRDGFLVTRDK